MPWTTTRRRAFAQPLPVLAFQVGRGRGRGAVLLPPLGQGPLLRVGPTLVSRKVLRCLVFNSSGPADWSLVPVFLRHWRSKKCSCGCPGSWRNRGRLLPIRQACRERNRIHVSLPRLVTTICPSAVRSGPASVQRHMRRSGRPSLGLEPQDRV